MRFPHPFIDGFMPYKPPPWIPPPWSILHYRTVLILLIAFFRFTTTIPIVKDPKRIFHSNIINCHANITTTTTSFPTTFTTSTILSLTMIRGDTTSSLHYDKQRVFDSNIINLNANITTTTTSFPTIFTTSTILSLTMIWGDTTSSLHYDATTTTSFPTTFTTSTILSLTMIRGDTTSSLHYDGFHSILNTRHTNYFLTNRHPIFTTTTLPLISNTSPIISTTSTIGDTILFSYPSFGTTILPLNIQQDKTNGNIILSTTIIDTHPTYNTNTPFISSSSLTLTDHLLITTKFGNTTSHINYYLHTINPTFIMVFVSPTSFCRPYLLLLPTQRTTTPFSLQTNMSLHLSPINNNESTTQSQHE